MVNRNLKVLYDLREVPQDWKHLQEQMLAQIQVGLTPKLLTKFKHSNEFN